LKARDTNAGPALADAADDKAAPVCCPCRQMASVDWIATDFELLHCAGSRTDKEDGFSIFPQYLQNVALSLFSM
jgi:hypothetical protein